MSAAHIVLSAVFLLLAVSPACAQDTFNSTTGTPPRGQDRFDSNTDAIPPRRSVNVPPHTCTPSCKLLQDQWRSSCGQPGTEHMAKSMTVEMPGCPSCQLQCSDAATAPRGPSKGIQRGGVEQQRDCDEAAAKGIRRPDCANVQKAGSPCEQLAAKGIYRADCDPCIKPGAKGLARGDCDQVRKRPDVPVPSPGASRLAQAIDDCFKKGELTYYRPPRIGVARGTVSYEPASQTILYDPAFLDRQLPFIRASWLGNAFGAHVLNLEKQRFGTDRTPAESRRIRDYFAGYAARCLVADRVISSGRNHPVHNVRDSYERYLREGGFTVPGEAPRTDSDIGDWERGWISWDAGIVWSLQHDPTMPTSSASDPFRLTP